jgi:hypothetical protein
VLQGLVEVGAIEDAVAGAGRSTHSSAYLWSVDPARRAASFAVARISILRAARNVAAARLRCRPSST